GTPGAFRGGLTYGSSYADFANSYDPINSYSQGSSGGGTYTVRAGDTLQGIAQAVWGDSSLWYKLAEANGLSGAAALAEGATLVLPGGVIKSAYNSNTLKPYNPAEAIGDVTPSTPAPQSPKKNKCGVFGMILLAVIAIAVTVVTAGAALAAAGLATSVGAGITTVVGGGLIGAAGLAGGIAIGAGAAAVGSIVSQGIGVATGIQEKFSWKAVGMAAIGGGVTAGIGGSGMFNGIGNDILRAGVSAAVGSALTQGLGVVTGLQKKFDWVGVAAAGVGAMAGQAVFGNLPSIAADNSIGNYAAHFANSAVNAIANAATRTALEGASFGANLAAAIPDVVAQTIGDLLFNGVAASKAKGDAPGIQVAARPTEQAAADADTAGECATAAIASGGLRYWVEPGSFDDLAYLDGQTAPALAQDAPPADPATDSELLAQFGDIPDLIIPPMDMSGLDAIFAEVTSQLKVALLMADLADPATRGRYLITNSHGNVVRIENISLNAYEYDLAVDAGIWGFIRGDDLDPKGLTTGAQHSAAAATAAQQPDSQTADFESDADLLQFARRVAAGTNRGRLAGTDQKFEKYVSMGRDGGGFVVTSLQVLPILGGYPAFPSGTVAVLHTHINGSKVVTYPNGTTETITTGPLPGPGDASIPKARGIPNFVVPSTNSAVPNLYEIYRVSGKYRWRSIDANANPGNPHHGPSEWN
ncbi:MAG: LysM peptidoglycan-binding domain-containing protein, partial [Pseudomonadota bacterium]